MQKTLKVLPKCNKFSAGTIIHVSSERADILILQGKAEEYIPQKEKIVFNSKKKKRYGTD